MASEVKKVLCELISIPSVNPELSSDKSIIGEEAICDYVLGFLKNISKNLGAETKKEKVKASRYNAIAYFYDKSIKTSEPKILLAPHLDTVNVENMSIKPFTPLEKNGRIYGRGASDTKGSIAAMLCALKKILQTKNAKQICLAFAGFCGEESGQIGSRHFGKNHADELDFAIIGEPTKLNVINKLKGCIWLEITTSGKAAHGSIPAKGTNAIFKMLKVINGLKQSYLNDWQVRYKDPDLGSTTINFGQINAGTQPNIVPDKCTLTIDLRYTPKFHAENSLKRITKIVKKIDSSAEIKELTNPCPPLNTDKDNKFVKQILSLGLKTKAEPWFCDASVLSACGLESVAVGPGSIEQAHTSDEWISLDELEKAVDIYVKIFNQLSN